MTPHVSIILPTYNRGDVIMRAIRSVIEQTYVDWELLIIDDGSTDNTQELDFSFDKRIRMIRQDNGGVARARNLGIQSAKGHLLAFIDSDDAWLPHFLTVATDFLHWSTGDHFVTMELLHEDTDTRMLKGIIRNAHQYIARIVGSQALDLPVHETDDYMRIYSTRESLDFPLSAPHSIDGLQDARLYRGYVFPHTRWGYLALLQTTVLTRHAAETVGPFVTKKPDGSTDYRFLSLLAKHFRANFISLPSARKHEVGTASRPLAAAHLATGLNHYNARVNREAFMDELHWSRFPHDRELHRVRRLFQYHTACLAIHSGMRSEAIRLLKNIACAQSVFWRAYILLLVAYCIRPSRFSTRLLHRFLEI